MLIYGPMKNTSSDQLKRVRLTINIEQEQHQMMNKNKRKSGANLGHQVIKNVKQIQAPNLTMYCIGCELNST